MVLAALEEAHLAAAEQLMVLLWRPQQTAAAPAVVFSGQQLKAITTVVAARAVPEDILEQVVNHLSTPFTYMVILPQQVLAAVVVADMLMLKAFQAAAAAVSDYLDKDQMELPALPAVPLLRQAVVVAEVVQVKHQAQRQEATAVPMVQAAAAVTTAPAAMEAAAPFVLYGQVA